MKLLAVLLKTTDRLVARVLLNALLFGALAAGVTLLVGAEGTGQWPPQQLAYVATAIIAGFAAYAAGVSVLLHAALHSVVRAAATAPQAEQNMLGGGVGANTGTTSAPVPPHVLKP